MLPDLTDVLPLAAAAEGWAQLHSEVTDALIGCAIAAGQAADVLGLAASAVAADPLREPAVLLQMRALAATGQAAGGDADRSRLPPPAGGGDRARSDSGTGAAGTRDRGWRRRAGPGAAEGDTAVRTTRLIGRDGPSPRCTGCSPRSAW